MFERPNWVVEWLALIIWIGFWIELPHVKDSVTAARDETCVIFEPGDALHWLDMAFKLELNRTLCCIELIHPDLLIVLACKEVSTMGKHDFSTFTDLREILVWNKRVIQDVHQSDRIAESNNEVETRWM